MSDRKPVPDRVSPGRRLPRELGEPPRVLPTRSDPIAAAASTAVGGPWGRHGVVGRQWFWTPLRVCLALTIVVLAFSWLQKSPCKDGMWDPKQHIQYTHMCYSDVVPLFFAEDLNNGAVPYRDHAVEYPVLTGGFMYVASLLSRTYDSAAQDANGVLAKVSPVESYFDVTALLLAGCALLVTWGVLRLSGRRPWDAAMVALSPLLFVHAFTNWDLFAVALTTAAMVAWQARRPVGAGVLVGLGAAAKLYPALLLVPIFLLCWRTRQWRDFARVTGAAVVAWAVVNLPVAALYRDSWWKFFSLNKTRPADPDSLWNVIQYVRDGTPLDRNVVEGQTPVILNTAVFVCLAAALVGIALLALRAPRRPRLPQLLFLVVAAFLLTNKVWSPQYSLWLVPLAVLARPSWRAYLAWQAVDAFLWFPRMYWYLGTANKGLEEHWFLLAVLLRDVAVVVYCGLVIRDILRPDRDVVRARGYDGARDGAMDDPAGGIFDGAADDPRLRFLTPVLVGAGVTASDEPSTPHTRVPPVSRGSGAPVGGGDDPDGTDEPPGRSADGETRNTT